MMSVLNSYVARVLAIFFRGNGHRRRHTIPMWNSSGWGGVGWGEVRNSSGYNCMSGIYNIELYVMIWLFSNCGQGS